MPQTRVAIVGSGIVGTAVAYVWRPAATASTCSKGRPLPVPARPAVSGSVPARVRQPRVRCAGRSAGADALRRVSSRSQRRAAHDRGGLGHALGRHHAAAPPERLPHADPVRVRRGLAVRLRRAGTVLLPGGGAARRVGDRRRQSLRGAPVPSVPAAAVRAELRGPAPRRPAGGPRDRRSTPRRRRRRGARTATARPARTSAPATSVRSAPGTRHTITCCGPWRPARARCTPTRPSGASSRTGPGAPARSSSGRTTAARRSSIRRR